MGLGGKGGVGGVGLGLATLRPKEGPCSPRAVSARHSTASTPPVRSASQMRHLVVGLGLGLGLGLELG